MQHMLPNVAHNYAEGLRRDSDPRDRGLEFVEKLPAEPGPLIVVPFGSRDDLGVGLGMKDHAHH